MRNPKRDPMPGDVLYKADSMRRVLAVDATHVKYATKTGQQKTAYIATWRYWAGNAKVGPSASTDGQSDDRLHSLSVRYVELEERVRVAEECGRLTEERLSRLEALIGSGPGIGVDAL